MGCDERFDTDDCWREREAMERRRERADKMRRRLAETPLSKFTADYTLDICIINGLHITNSLGDVITSRLDEALDRLEKFFKDRKARKR